MSRQVLPACFQAQAATLDWAAATLPWPGGSADGALAAVTKSPSRQSYQLRWMLSPRFGLPRAPFRVFFLNAQLSLTSYPGLACDLGGHRVVSLPKPAARLVLVLNLTAAGAAAYGSTYNDALAGVASTTGTGQQVLSMDASAISYVTIVGQGSLIGVWLMGADDLANDPAWKEVERVGLPLSAPADFNGTKYDAGPQGLVASPVDPYKAAVRRLNSGAPLVGWSPALPSGAAAPTWKAAQTDLFLASQQATLLPKLISMMKQSGAPWKDRLNLLDEPITQAPGNGAGAASSKVSYSPLMMLLMAASSDPFSALGLGFGTAYTPAELKTLLPTLVPAPATPPSPAGRLAYVGRQGVAPFIGAMVTCDVWFNLSLAGMSPKPLTLASIVLSNGQLEVVPPAANLAASISGTYPPEQMDGPWRTSVRVAWSRPQALLALQSNPGSYAIVRAQPGVATPAPLNKARPGGGLLPYIPALAPEDAPDTPVTFDDLQAPVKIPNAALAYHVAAQDWFGVWSPWASASVTLPGEPPQAPALSDPKWTLNPGANPFNATLSFQVAWDWTTRSPKQINLFVDLLCPASKSAALPKGMMNPPGMRKTFGGALGTPVAITFGPDQKPLIPPAVGTVALVPAPSYKASGRDVRVYQVTLPGFTLDFTKGGEIVAQIWATGATALNPASFSGAVEPVNLSVLSPLPPPTPQMPDMLWATLPDPAGISRAHLTWNNPKWPGAPEVVGYHVYEATETRLIALAQDANDPFLKPPAALAGQPPAPLPDLTAPFAGRLDTLRNLGWSKLRPAFTRLNSTALTAPELEVLLPRGSRVIHAYVVTAVSANGVESAFPTASQFIAVAAPFVQVCQPPRISAQVQPNGDVKLTLEQRGRVRPQRYEILTTRRDDLAADPGLMGKPLALGVGTTKTVPGSTPHADPVGVTTFLHTGAARSWNRVWYRGFAVTDDNRDHPAPTDAMPPWGALGGRSRPTEAVSVMLPPLTPPAAPTLNQPLVPAPFVFNPQFPQPPPPPQNAAVGGNVLLLINTPAPAAATPLGSHVLKIEQRNGKAAATGAKDPPPVYLPLEAAAPVKALSLTGPLGQVFRLLQAGQTTTVGIRLKTTATTTVTVTLTDPLGRSSAPVVLTLQ